MDTRRVNRSGKSASVESIMPVVPIPIEVRPKAKPKTKDDMGHRKKRVKPKMKQAQSSTASGSPFKCSICSKDFTTNSNLLRHKRLHTHSKPFPKSKKLKVLEKAQKKSRFTCRYCKDGFPSMELHRSHIKQVHSERKKKTKQTKNVGNKRKYICGYCGLHVANTVSLSHHMLIHTGQITFQCDVCNIQFERKDHLKDHLSTHDKNPYKCDVCGLSYHKRFGMIRHISQVHPAVDIQAYLNQPSKPKTRHFEKRESENRVKTAIIDAIRNVFKPPSSAFPLKKKTFPPKDNMLLKKKSSPQKGTVSRNSNKIPSQRRHVPKRKIVQKKDLSPLLPKSSPKIPKVKEKEIITMEVGDVPFCKPPIEQKRAFQPSLQPQITPPPKKELEQRKCKVCSKEMETDHNLTVHALVLHPAKGQGVVCGVCQKPFPSLHLLSRHYEYCHSDDKNAAEEAKIILSSSKLSALNAQLVSGVVLDEVESTTTCQHSNSSPEQDQEKMKEAVEWPLILQRLRSPDAYTVSINVAHSQKIKEMLAESLASSSDL